MTGGPDFILLHVSSIEEAVSFYTEKLGLEVDGPQSPTFVQFKQPGGKGSILALSVEEGNANTPGNSTELWWFVDDVNATHKTLASRGVEIASPLVDMPFGRTFSVKGPSDHTMYMLQLAAA